MVTYTCDKCGEKPLVTWFLVHLSDDKHFCKNCYFELLEVYGWWRRGGYARQKAIEAAKTDS